MIKVTKYISLSEKNKKINRRLTKPLRKNKLFIYQKKIKELSLPFKEE